MKTCALGFVLHKNAYLRSAWNVGDFMIVLVGLFSLFVQGNNLDVIRLVRLMRPLRAIRRVRGMRVLVNTLMQALPMMVDVLWLLLLVMYVFAVLGIQMWKGVLHKRCYYSSSPDVFMVVPNDTDVCGSRECAAVSGLDVVCEIRRGVEQTTILNFDYIWNAMLLVFKVVTLDDWPADMEQIQDASGNTAWLYFVLLTLIGGYFCLNLVLAILAVVYTETQRAKLSAVRIRVVPQCDLPPTATHAEKDIIKLKVEEWRREVDEQNRLEGRASRKKRQSVSATKLLMHAFAFGPKKDDTLKEMDRVEQEERLDMQRTAQDNTRFIAAEQRCTTYTGLLMMHTVGALAVPDIFFLPQESNSDDSSLREEVSSESSSSEDEQEEEVKVRKFWAFRRPFRRIANNKYFNYMMLLITGVNVVMMACDHLGASADLLALINNTNLVASWCFLYEMIFKIIGFGPRKYFRDGYNVMDCLLVVLSIPEMFSLIGNLSSFAAFRAFRGFRLMVRIKPLQQTVSGIARSVVAVLWLLLLMLLIIFIYAMLGLSLFQATLGEDDRENFRSLWEAAVTVFVVITGDTWATIMKKAMDNSSYAAALYFISLFCIGNLMLTNLFIAILIDHFKVSDDSEVPETHATTKPAQLKATIADAPLKRKGAQWDEKAVVAPNLKRNAVRFEEEVEMEEISDDDESRVALEEPALRQFKREWGGGWRVSISTKHDRPYWWNRAVTAQRLWVCPLSTSDKHLTEDEALELHKYRAQTQQAQKCLEQIYATPFASFCPYQPPPGEYKRLMQNSLEAALQFPNSGNLRLFKVCATARTLEYLKTVWMGDAQKKRIFLQHLADAGVLSPSVNPPWLSNIVDDALILRGAGNPYGAGRESCATSDSGFESSMETDAEDLDAKLWKASHRSLGLFSRENVIRRALARVVLHKRFDDVIIVMILINAVFLALDDYYAEERPGGRKLLEVANKIFIAITLMETVSKVIVLGLVGKWCERHPDGTRARSYLDSLWNRVDFVVAVSMLADLMGVPFANKLRCARTLRLLVRLEALQVVVRALLRAAPQIIYICIVCLFVWIVFGILGVQLFKGEFYGCNDATVIDYHACIGTYAVLQVTAFDSTATVQVPREWSNYRVHFDNLAMSLLTLFEVAVVENWAPIMWRGIDGNPYGTGPVVNAHPVRALFFIGFVVVGNFFCINLFVGTLINRFNSDMETLLTRSQAKDAAYYRLLSLYRMDYIPVRPKNRLRNKCYDLIHKEHFDVAILCLILLNCAVLGTERYNQGDDWTMFLTVSDYLFVVIFSCEALVKMLALGLAGYFRESWNRFDFVCVASSIIGIAFQGVNTGGFRVIRVVRAFRLLKRARRLELLFHTMLRSLPSLGNIVLLMCYVFFNWGVVGVEMFKNVKQNPKLGSHSNFRTLPAAVLVLYQIGTTETWTSVMEGTSLAPPECEPALDNCGKSWGNYPYFVSYMIVGSFVFMNLFIFVVLHNFENDRLDIQEQRTDSRRGEVHRGFALLRKAWLVETARQSKTDRMVGHTNRIDVSAFVEIIQTIPEPVWKRPVRMFLRTPAAVKWLNLIRNIRGLPVTIPVYKPRRQGAGHQLEYADVLKALSMHVVGLRKEDVYSTRSIHEQEEESKSFDLHQYVGAQRLLQIWRERQAASAELLKQKLENMRQGGKVNWNRLRSSVVKDKDKDKDGASLQGVDVDVDTDAESDTSATANNTKKRHRSKHHTDGLAAEGDVSNSSAEVHSTQTSQRRSHAAGFFES